jgi:predicted PurR-regulated permease PerM
MKSEKQPVEQAQSGLEVSRLEQNLGRSPLLLQFIGCLSVLWPFVPSLLWATALAFALWPLFGRLVKLLGGRGTLAAIFIGVLIGPTLLAVGYRVVEEWSNVARAPKAAGTNRLEGSTTV